MKEEKSKEETPNEEELASIMEAIKNRVATETYVGPGPSRKELQLKAKNRTKNKLARKVRRAKRKRK